MTQPTTDDDAPDYLAEIADIAKLVESGHELVAQGNTIDLTNLESLIGDLCRRMVDVPPENAEAVRSAIENVVGDLTRLGDALRRQVEPKH